MSDAVTKLREALVTNILTRPATASPADRRAAYDHATAGDHAAGALLDKVTRNAWKVTDEDVAGAKAAGATEDQIFELVACAAIGQATRQLDSALAALDAVPAPAKAKAVVA